MTVGDDSDILIIGEGIFKNHAIIKSKKSG
jgi:hypothetical protein